ncbi:MAG: hypothetical protein AB1801_23290 [Chloroflexota bacterium]
MKTDKFLIGIVSGIVVLVIIAVIAVLTRGQAEEYIADDTPAGVVHNYFLALHRQDYNKAYGYLSDELKAKPDLDQFITTVDNAGARSEDALKIGESTITGDRAQVEVSITTYSRGGGPFELGGESYTNRDNAHLRLAAAGRWQLIEFPYPYWGYDWNQPPAEK